MSGLSSSHIIQFEHEIINHFNASFPKFLSHRFTDRDWLKIAFPWPIYCAVQLAFSVWNYFHWFWILTLVCVEPVFVACYNLGQNGWKIKTTPSPISMMEKWRVFVVARVHHWIGGRATPISHFILSKIAILDKMDEKLRPPLPPFQWWKNGAFSL